MIDAARRGYYLRPMKQSSQYMSLLAKTSSGLEPVLADELQRLGASEVATGKRLVRFQGDREMLYRANLGCRTAIRILLPVSQFHARNRRELYNAVRRVDFGQFMSPKNSLAVDAITFGEPFANSLFAAQITKDAIVDQFRDKHGVRPDVDLKNPDSRINIHITGHEATLSIDTSGESLSHRGYRTHGGGKAPLSEVLAAGMVLLSGWNGDKPLVDGMCGSGTIAIEAALIAANIAPGLLRSHYAFEHFADLDTDLLDRVRNELKARVTIPPQPTVFASDISGKPVELARANARRAGVAEQISFAVQPFEQSQPPGESGAIVMNPPYGERLKPRDLEELYSRIGDTLKQNYQGFTAWILTGNLEAAKRIGLRTSRKIKLYNGPTECRLLKFELYQGSRKG